MPRPLILITNDDGVRSPGLIAAVTALRGLGDLYVVAPREQQSSSGRAFYWKHRRALKRILIVGQTRVPTIAVDASPAVSVRHALMLGVPRPPTLVVSGINYGENLGSGLTISGTVGAALEAAAEGIPALAVSLQTAPEYHTLYSTDINFAIAGYWTRWLATRILQNQVSRSIPLLNLNVPRSASRTTPWRITRASHEAYFRSLVRDGRFVGYDVIVERERLERDSDIYAILIDQVISITPLTYDLTAHVNFKTLKETLTVNHGG